MAPAAWLVDHAHLLPAAGTALDVACGSGRHALWLAERGLAVVAVDRNRDAIRELADEANRRNLKVMAQVDDLERADISLGSGAFDLIVVVHYLHRRLFPALTAALKPGGLLVYETFTRAQARRGRPTNPDFLLNDGELEQLVQPLSILDAREGEVDGRDVASVVAQKRSA